MRRVLLLIPSTSYRAGDFLAAATRLDVRVVVGSDHTQVLACFSDERTLTINLTNPDKGLEQISSYARRFPLAAIVGVDEETTVLAARAARALSLRHNSERSVAAAHDKHRLRQLLEQAGLRCPWYRLIEAGQNLELAAGQARYPCVLKPLSLSASRGVIRADNPSAFVRAANRVRYILGKTTPASRTCGPILVEQFIPGCEVALEGLLENGRLKVLALFDKPDPLDGPFFEETIYVTPSRLTTEWQRDISVETETAAFALGLETGPIHAELRVNEQGPWIIELAPRTIGGLCSRSLRFSGQITLEELVLRQAMGEPVANLVRDEPASGVMMIPIAKAGRLQAVHGLEAARSVTGVDKLDITIPIGEQLVPLPEGHRYLGFIFARSNQPGEVEASLRLAHSKLEIVVE